MQEGNLQAPSDFNTSFCLWAQKGKLRFWNFYLQPGPFSGIQTANWIWPLECLNKPLELNMSWNQALDLVLSTCLSCRLSYLRKWRPHPFGCFDQKLGRIFLFFSYTSCPIHRWILFATPFDIHTTSNHFSSSPPLPYWSKSLSSLTWISVIAS